MEIASLTELRRIYEQPTELAVRKELDHCDKHCRDFIGRSPFVAVSTSDAEGWPDVSPRGVAPGFVTVVEDKVLHLPDRPGNNRLDSFQNIIANPRIALLFLVPGRLETLRVNGTARLLTDPALLAKHAVRNKPARLDGHIWVPIDDFTTHVYNIMCAPHEEDVLTPEAVEKRETAAGRGKNDTIPGTFRLKRNQSNDYFIDRQMQKTQNFTGIVGVNTQDFALQEGMGPICDRSKEFLGTSDKAIVALRRLLLDAVSTNEKGGTLRALDPKTYRTVRAYDRVVTTGEPWKVAMEKDLVAVW